MHRAILALSSAVRDARFTVAMIFLTGVFVFGAACWLAGR